MHILRIDQALERCEEHLTATSAFGTQIDSLLTHALLVLMYAEFEKTIKKLMREKCSSVKDESIRGFLGECVKAVFRGLKLSDMAGSINKFGTVHKEIW